ncbi:MAG: hypothetical protein HKN68_21140 [Saprospiraceae bacterium]|nr:hypothetical protein [Saprospiraceae bacterium]
MYRLLFLVLIVAMVACKNDGGSATEKADPGDQPPNSTQLQEERYVAPTRDNVPFVADLVSKEQMEEWLGLESGKIYDVVINNNAADKNSNSAFYSIDDPDLGNAAVMLQVSSNPLPTDISDSEFASYYINNKITEGERDLSNPEVSIKFDEWDMGVSGAYNKDLGKYYWRDKEHFIYLFATNTTLPIERQYQAAQKVARSITPK